MGDSLEIYIRDLFCNSINKRNYKEKNKCYSDYFSYIGNQNNPPDIMIKDGDAIEVKKIENFQSSIALNSSHPKDKLYSDNPMITSSCRNCESWKEKDLIYAIGVLKENKLKKLWFIDGKCYSANKEVYEKINQSISNGINELENVAFSKTKELARMNKVDPLGITYLRVRGMWGIENPEKVFSYILPPQTKSFSAHAILTTNKYLSFPEPDRKSIEELSDINFSIKNVDIKSPNNPAKLLSAKLLSFTE